MCPFANMSPGLKCQLRPVIVVESPQGANYCQVVRALADVLKPIPDYQPALAIILESGLQRHDHLAISMGWISPHDVGVDLFRVEHSFVRRILDGLPGVLVQLRFDIEAFEM